MQTEDFISFVLYNKPKDFPEHVVARKFIWDQPTKEFELFKTLERAREVMEEKGLICITRAKKDNPVIVETWL